MKRFLFPVISLVLLAACTDMHSLYDQPGNERIALQVVSGTPTKAPVSGTTFSTSRSMQMAAYYQPTTEAAQAGGTAKNYFPLTDFSYNSQDALWTAEDRYWPFSGTLSLLAWSLGDGSQSLTPVIQWLDAADFSRGVVMEMPDNSTKQVDVLFGAKGAATRENNTMVFRHALSWLEFQASCSKADVITIRGITINDACHSGTLTATRSGDDIVFDWSSLDDRKDVDLLMSRTSLTPAWTTLGGGLLVPPQATGSTVHFTIHYTMKVVGRETSPMHYTCSFEGVEWQPGTKYIYKIDMSVDALGVIGVSAEALPWTTGDERTCNIPSDRRAGTSGKPFSVSATKRVYISSANLMFDMVDEKFKLMEHAYDLCEEEGEHVGPDYSNRVRQISTNPEKARISFFGWATAGSMRTHVITTYDDLEDYICGTPGAGEMDPYYDWGNNILYSYNDVAIGGRNTWRAMSKDEWRYLFIDRENAAQKYGVANITTTGNGVCGMVLLPEDWTLPSGCSFTPGLGLSVYHANTYTIAQWEAMEASGAIFLPASGLRDGETIDLTNEWGLYWTTTAATDYSAYYLAFDFEDLYVPGDPNIATDMDRNSGASVRLVRQGYAHPNVIQKEGTSGKAFRVGDGPDDLVFIAKSNLKYNNSNNSKLHLCFMQHAYDMVEQTGDNIGNFYFRTDIVSLFGWGASEVERRPAKQTAGHSQAYLTTSVLTSGTDWGLANDIWSADGSTVVSPAGSFRTLSSTEWTYLLKSRPDYANKYGQASIIVSGTQTVHGLILLPDDWTLPSGCTFTPGAGAWNQNELTLGQWAAMEASGAVFLPAAGYRTSNGTSSGICDYIANVGAEGLYWARNLWGDFYAARNLGFSSGSTPSGDAAHSTWFGLSVRLVRDVE